MAYFSCYTCRSTCSIPPTAQRIICIHCHTLHSLTIPGKVYSRTATASADAYKGSQEQSLDTSKKKSVAKLLSHSLRRKLSFAAPQQDPPTPPRDGRRALVCGVSYKKQKHELKGSALGVRKMIELLRDNFRFPQESLLVLAEEDGCPPPTRRNIEEGFRWLVKGIRSGDSLLFYFFGHGKRQREQATADEIDETICPVDFEENGMIADNFINRAIVKPLVPGVRLHAIIDSCHVGTIIDSPRFCDASMSFENMVDNYVNHAIVRRPLGQGVKLHTIKGGTILDLPRVCDARGKWEDNSTPSGAYKGTKGGKVICFSAYEDYQLAADTTCRDKEMTGVMSITLINAIKESIERNEKISYQGIMDYMHDSIKQACNSRGLFTGIRPRILQGPLLSSTEEFNTSTKFEL